MTGEAATARSYVDAIIMAPDGQSGFNATGFYDDELVRTASGWRIAQRRYTMVRFAVIGATAAVPEVA
jgi:SnoaL-like domain